MTFRRRSIGSGRPVRSSLRVGLHIIVWGPSCCLSGQVKKVSKEGTKPGSAQEKIPYMPPATDNRPHCGGPAYQRGSWSSSKGSGRGRTPRRPPFYINWREHKFQKRLKGIVQRKLTGVESDINQKVFLSHWTADIYFLNFKGTCFLNSKKPDSVAKAKICGLSNSIGRPLQITDSGEPTSW